MHTSYSHGTVILSLSTSLLLICKNPMTTDGLKINCIFNVRKGRFKNGNLNPTSRDVNT